MLQHLEKQELYDRRMDDQITDEPEYRRALKELGPLFDLPEPEPGTAEYEHLKSLAKRVELYEALHYPIG